MSTRSIARMHFLLLGGYPTSLEQSVPRRIPTQSQHTSNPPASDYASPLGQHNKTQKSYILHNNSLTHVMSDRSRAATNGNGVSRTRNGTSSAASVRRNLFQSQLTRRPTGGGSSSTSAETLHLDVDVLSDTSEIVVRDKHGEIELGDPPTPMLEDEDDVPMDHRQETESMLFTCDAFHD